MKLDDNYYDCTTLLNLAYLNIFILIYGQNNVYLK